MPKIFISYRREDSLVFAGRICDRLITHFGRDSVFMDVDSIPVGVDFREHLTNAVGGCDVFLALIGEKWLSVSLNGRRRLDDPKDFVRIEVEAALQRGIPVVPLLLGKATMPVEAELPDSLANLTYRNAAQVDGGRDFHTHLDRLIRGLENLTRSPKPSESAPKRTSKPSAQLAPIPLVDDVSSPASQASSQKPKPAKTTAPSSPTPSKPQAASPEDAITSLLGRLPRPEAMAVRMFYLDGCSYDEIAKKLNLPATSISEILTKAKKELRSIMAGKA